MLRNNRPTDTGKKIGKRIETLSQSFFHPQNSSRDVSDPQGPYFLTKREDTMKTETQSMICLISRIPSPTPWKIFVAKCVDRPHGTTSVNSSWRLNRVNRDKMNHGKCQSKIIFLPRKSETVFTAQYRFTRRDFWHAVRYGLCLRHCDGAFEHKPGNMLLRFPFALSQSVHSCAWRLSQSGSWPGTLGRVLPWSKGFDFIRDDRLFSRPVSLMFPVRSASPICVIRCLASAKK